MSWWTAGASKVILKDRGYEATSRNFGETPHVGHMRANPELYWGEILGVWRA